MVIIMKRAELEKLFEVNGLTNYRFRTVDDLLLVGIDYKKVKGYDALTDEHRTAYEVFLVKFLNGIGMDSKAQLVLKSINFVEDIDYLAKKKDQNGDYFQSLKRTIKSVDKNGVKKILHTYKWNANEEKLKVDKEEVERYLRFEYKHYKCAEWLHIIKNGTQWY